MEIQGCILVPLLLLFIVLGAVAGLPSTEHVSFHSEEADTDPPHKWQVVTSDNFTEHVHKHDYTLCISRVHWCGEARSLMNGISRLLKDEPAIVPDLSLCAVNSDRDRRLSDHFFGGRSPSFTFFQQNTPFKFSGRLSSEHLVAAVRHAMSMPPEYLPFRHVTSSEQLRALIESTDIAVVLIDRCGWAKAQLTSGWGSDFDWRAEFGSSEDYGISSKKEKLGGLGRTAWYLGCYPEGEDQGQQCYARRRMWWSDDMFGCTLTKLQHFVHFFRNLTRLAASHVLTPHRARFALVTDDKVAAGAGFHLAESHPWVLAAKVHDFHYTPHFYGDKDDIEGFFSSLLPLVHELDGEVGDFRPVFWNRTPSVVLFIDRASTSNTIQEKSNAALNVLRAVARHYDALDLTFGSSIPKDKPLKVHVPEKGMVTTLKYPHVPVEFEEIDRQGTAMMGKEVGMQLTSRKDEVLLDLCGSEEALKVDQINLAVPDQLKVALGALGTREVPLPSIAVDQINSGAEGQVLLDAAPLQMFRGLNDITDNVRRAEEAVRVLDGSTSETSIMELTTRQTKVGSSTLPSCVEGEPRSGSSVNSAGQMGRSRREDYSLKGVRTSAALKRGGNLESGEVLSDGVGRYCSDLQASPRGGTCAPGSCCREVTVAEESLDPQGMEGDWEEVVEEEVFAAKSRRFPVSETLANKSNAAIAFFFWDGECDMKQKLTASVASPLLVVLHPEKASHYVYPIDLGITKASVIEFLDLLLSGKLQRSTPSEPGPLPPRNQPQPPLLNDDFHEIDAVPRVTVNSFGKLVFGFEESHHRCGHFTCVHDQYISPDGAAHVLRGQPWEKDVVVLFTTSWCGFCKRMELVFKEVHRAIERYVSLADTVLEGLSTSTEVTKVIHSPTGHGLPVLLQMDCVLNDCGERLKHVMQEEVYPALILFPSRKKSSPILYHGGVTVSGLISFLVAHGTASVNLQQLVHGVERVKSKESPGSAHTAMQLDLLHIISPGNIEQMSDCEINIVRNSRPEGVSVIAGQQA